MCKIFHTMCFSTLALACGAAYSQAYPSKPVKLIVPNAPTSAPDVAARMLSERLSRTMGQQFILENNTAGSGLIAAQQAARATPDGYTLFIGSGSGMVVNPNIFKSVGYDTLKDFSPIAFLGESAFIIAVHPDVPAKSIADWIALAKAQPGKLSYGADAGVNGIVGAWFNKMAGINTVHVPYKQLAPQIQDTVAGRTQMILVSAVAIEPMVKAGKLRPIGLTSARRFPGMEHIPTVAETVPGFQVGGWFILTAPTGLPLSITQRLNNEVDQFLKDPAVVDKFRAFGFENQGAGSLPEVREFVRTELEKWARIAKEAGVELQ
ncbi:MAG: Bug family tripartite tricarboxylate transporter substrate binding protein [Burkholderiales bacterium]